MDEEIVRFNTVALSPDVEHDSVDEYAEDLIFNERPPAKQVKTSDKQRTKMTATKKTAFSWEDGLVHFIINEWKQLPVLCNTADPDYSNKDKESTALGHIVTAITEYGTYDPIPDKTDIQEKMGNLRVYYNVQKRKVDASKGTGSGASAVFKSGWKFYDELDFLRDMVTPRSTLSNLDSNDVSYSDVQDVQRVQKENRRKRQSPSPAMEVMKEATNVLRTLQQQKENTPPAPVRQHMPATHVPCTHEPTPKTSNELFGATVAKFLDEIPDMMTRDKLKIDIQNMIFIEKYYPQFTQSRDSFSQLPPRSFRINQGSSTNAPMNPGSSSYPQHPLSAPSTPQYSQAASTTTTTLNLNDTMGSPHKNILPQYTDFYGSPVYQPPPAR